jgi:hypothetical protein
MPSGLAATAIEAGAHGTPVAQNVGLAVARARRVLMCLASLAYDESTEPMNGG